MSAAPFQQTVATLDELRTLYRRPHDLVVAKERQVLDAATTAFLGRATFAVVSTFGADGAADASPRGGPSGFIQVLSLIHI